MNFVVPCDLTWYKLLTDWGSLISGGLALAAGGAAYLAGVHQAHATRAAAAQQIDAINQQRKDEIANVCESVRIEVTTYTKYVIGTLLTCERVVKKELQIPRQAANYIAKMLYDSAVYPAIADRIGILPNPQATVEFYMRIAEAKASANVLATKIDQPSATNVSASPLYLTGEDVAAIADSLITALQLAKPIVSAANQSSTPSPLYAYVRGEALKAIEEALASAKVMFPHAESFKVPPR